MALMQRTQIVWEGFPGAPGYSTFYTRVSDPVQHDTRLAAAALRDGLITLQAFLPNTITLTFPTETAFVEDTTGEMVELAQMSPGVAALSGNTAGDYSAASGAAVRYRTQAVRRGRRVNGRTYFVPLKVTAYDATGTLSSSALNALRQFADVIEDEGGPQFLVWSRPIYDKDTGALIEEGSSHRVQQATVADRVAVLRSRRD